MKPLAALAAVLACCPWAGRADEVRVSHCFSGDTPAAINDGLEPRSPIDRPRHSFWPHQGTAEWVEWRFDAPRKVAATEIYWLDDTPGGGCPVPESWRLFYRRGDQWLPVANPSGFGVKKGEFNRVTFDPVETPALRIEVKSRSGCGSGIIEWDPYGDGDRAARRERARRRAALDRLRFQPRDSALLSLVRDTDGFSDEARAYFDELAALGRDRAAIGDDEAAIAAMLERARRLFADQVRRIGPIAFFTRHPLTRPNAINCYIWQSVPEKWGCSIRVIDPSQADALPRTIFSDPDGSIFDMNVSRDGRTLFFSFRRREEPCWQLYEIGVEGSPPKRISRDGAFHEVGAAELPDGELVFVSTRRGGYTLCQPGPCSNLHVMRRDGSNVRCVSQNTLADFSPQMLPDGRVIFSRWEYVDRDLTYRQSLWTQNPDGRRYQLFFGNTVRDVGTFWQARPAPGHDNLVVATFAPHHGWPHGAIGLIQNRQGLETPRSQGFAWITNEFPQIGDQSFHGSYRDPFPLSDYQFLVAYGGSSAPGGRFAVCLLDLSDNTTVVSSDPEMGCYNPLALRPQANPAAVAAIEKEHVEAADGSDAGNGSDVAWGQAMVADVYQGLPGIERGRVKFLQIMEQVRKTHDLRQRAYDQSPVMSYGTYYAKRCWGRVPVEADGSARFFVPALREIYFQALDAEGRELQRQTSAVQLMPGETQSCIGCHEPRNMAPPAGLGAKLIAWEKPPVRPQFPPWSDHGIIDFVTVVQPVLDKHCVECHEGPDPDGGYDLSGDKTRLFNMAYDNLLGRSRSYRQHDMAAGQMLPDEAAKGKPLVHFYWLLRTPTAVNRPIWTGSHASRLPEYIETDHCGHKVPPEDRQRIYAWIDANVPYYATYANSRPNSPGCRDLCTEVDTGKPSPWFAERFLGVYDRRCRSCHNAFPEPNDHRRIWDGRYAWINFSRPEHSAALTAHLAKETGGRGRGTEADGRGQPLFRDKSDPDYAVMLDAIEEGRRKMLEHPRADMPGFAPPIAAGQNAAR